MLRNLTAVEFYKIHVLANAANKDYAALTKHKKIEDVFKNWIKEKEEGREIYKGVRTIDNSLTGDCDDFTTMIVFLLKNFEGKDPIVLFFINDRDFCYHVAPGYKENGKLHIIDVYKFRQVNVAFPDGSKNIFKYYKKAKEIKQFRVTDLEVK